MQLTIDVPDQIAAEARARGVSAEAYVQELIANRVNANGGEQRNSVVAAAVDRILERRERHRLGGLKIKDLITEGRKY